MNSKLKIGGAVAALALVIGLAIGFSPVTASDSQGSGAHCGSAFAPASDPTGTSDEQTWGNILGFTPTSPGTVDMSGACTDQLGPSRGFATVFCAAGAIGLLAVGLRVQRARREAVDETAKAEAATEAQWRAAGYVPQSEAPVPPPGWVRVDPALNDQRTLGDLAL